ncbi:TPA: phage repressor protein [Enterobacter cloacae]|nr:phage repressor protein [Enterobacter pasteurii]
MKLEKGGRGAIERMVEAYGFKTRQALCDHLGVSKSTLATRSMRDSFPAEWVIQCALENKVSLNWLVSGVKAEEPTKAGSQNENIIIVDIFKITKSELAKIDILTVDKRFVADGEKISFAIESHDSVILLSQEWSVIVDGIWLINLDGEITLRKIIKLPKKRVRVVNNDSEFECHIDELNISAKVVANFIRG